VAAKAETLSLSAVQLHGDEDQAYIDALRSAGTSGANLESAERGDTLPARNLNHVDKYVLDNGQGGTGQRFDWSLLNGEVLDNVLLAGGLSPDNCVEAAKPAAQASISIQA
jgi:indole-3-glycerol phosphate synthase/phosphoribosylanthranilate isomerase